MKFIIMFPKYLLYFSILLASCNSTSAENSNNETKFTDVPQPAAQAQPAIVSFVSSNERFYQQKAPAKPTLQLQLTAWKNEKISCQVVVWANKDLQGFKLVADNQTDELIKNNIHFGFLKNVKADYSAGYCGTVPKNLAEIDVPDEITNDTSGDIKAGQLQALWITIKLSKDIKEGLHTVYLAPQYNGSSNMQTLALQIKVNENALPDPDQWSFHLDLWQYPLRVAKYYKVKPWSAEHFNALMPSMKMLANAGQKAITASFFWDNLNNENYGFDNLMVKVNRNSNGTLSFDFTNFDKWVEFMMSIGIKDQINCFGMYPFTGNLSYYITDNVQNKTVTNSFKLNSDDYKAFWSSFLKAFDQHLREKKWIDKTVIFFDERPFKNVIELAGFIKSIDPAFKIGYAGGYDPNLISMLYDFTIPSYLKISNDDLAKRRTNNLTTTFYTTCFEKKPNQFTFSDPAESVFMGWYAFANGYNGYLRYAFNMWESNSQTDSRSGIVPAGDKFMIYPDSYSSVRFEKLIEGIQDYEKLSIITAQLRRSKNNQGLQSINTLLKNFNIDNVKNISDYEMLVENAQHILNSF